MRSLSGILSMPAPRLDRLPLGPFGATATRARMTGLAVLAPLWVLPLGWDVELSVAAVLGAVAAAVILFRRGSQLARGGAAG